MKRFGKFLLILICAQASLRGNTEAISEYIASLKEGLNSYLPVSELPKRLQLSQEDIEARGRQEIASFISCNVWKGGYCEGNPLNPHGASVSGFAFMDYKGQRLSPLYVCYLECIEPYVMGKDVLEIGPGQGGWSRAILSRYPRSFTCVDGLSAEHNEFWKHVGYRDNARYVQVSDFSLSQIADDSIDYVFSFGAFCHISPLLIREYLKNLYPKLRHGAQCFIAYADYAKYAEYYAKQYGDINPNIVVEDEFEHYHQPPGCGRWYHLGIDRAEAMLSELGYTVISADMQANERDPIMHFVKP